MNWQYLIVAIIFAAAVYYVIKTIRGNSKGHDHCGNGDCTAHSKSIKKDNEMIS